MGMGMDEVDIQPRPPQQQQITAPQQQQQQHSVRHHPLRSGGGGGGAGGGLTLSLPLHLAASSSSKAAANTAPAVSLAPPANGSAAASTAPNGHLPPSTGAAAAATVERGHGGHGHGRDDCWSEGATYTLIEAWGHRYLELNRGNLKQKHWKDVADAVSNREGGTKTAKTDVQCKNRLDTLKKKYKLEKSKIFNAGGMTKWPFFHKLDELIGPSRKHQVQQQQQPKGVGVGVGGGGGVSIAQAAPALPASSSAKPMMKRSHPDEHPALHMPMAMNHNHHLHVASAAAANNSASSKSDETPDTADSYPNGIDMTINGKGHHGSFKKRRLLDSGNPNPSPGPNANPFSELTEAILKFGEVYERVENSKLQNFIDMEKQRMEFVKEMEIQRLELFMQAQLEIAKMKRGKHGSSTEHYL
uniref:Myb/SANT-like DNA-binding domain-containing protein n=1 Tax=Araucaria cunninghamii TaxID=56994 RepID=A0A0D6QX65_ARACU